MKKALTTLGLAASIAGCGAANSDIVRYNRDGLTYIVQHETGLSVPEYGWSDAARRAIDFAQDGRLPQGYGLTGHLHEDGTTYQEGEQGPRYDAVLWTADTNRDGRPDLIRLVVNTQITTAPNIRSVGRSISLSALVQDVDHDGNADRGWVDDHDAQGNPGPDGVYDEFEMIEEATMQELIDDLIWYPRR